ncbi:unnamed protein product, partial [marine sediment metagenome]
VILSENEKNLLLIQSGQIIQKGQYHKVYPG